MNLDTKARLFTLDWDDITTRELEGRLREIARHPMVKSVSFRSSANSGYHIQVRTYEEVEILRLRRRFRDDGRRIVNDILNRPPHIHDILWDSKRIDGIIFQAGDWSIYP